MGCAASVATGSHVNVTSAAGSVVDNPALEQASVRLSGLDNDIEKLLIDDCFPPLGSSLCSGSSEHDVAWRRPTDLSSCPTLVSKPIGDVLQGRLGDCWFLSACVAVAHHPKAFSLVLSSCENFRRSHYTGLFHFQFWRFGWWESVIVDDYLPTEDGGLIYARSDKKDEFWPALLEKAYAKLHGSYEALEGGQTSDALVDLTGGVAESYRICQDTADDLFDCLEEVLQSGACVTCAKKGEWRKVAEPDAFGLTPGHTYPVTHAARIVANEGAERLVRLHSLWGTAVRWLGAWSPGDHLWSTVSETQLNKLKYASKTDAEFYMNWTDFCMHFDHVTICRVQPFASHVDQAAHYEQIYGKWITGVNAGGCRNELSSYASNPQFMLTVSELESEPAAGSGTLKTAPTVLIALMQNAPTNEKRGRLDRLAICIHVYKAPDPLSTRPLGADYFRVSANVASSGKYVDLREVVARFPVTPGCTYCIVASTFRTGDAARFLLRLFANTPFHAIQCF